MPFEVITGDEARKLMEQMMKEHKEYNKKHPEQFKPFGYKWNNEETTKYLWKNAKYKKPVTEDENERYEECCRFMISMGLNFLDKQKQDYPTEPEPKFGTIPNVYGLTTSMNPNSKELKKHIVWKVEDYFGKSFSPTGAMMQAVLETIQWVMHHSWDEYMKDWKE